MRRGPGAAAPTEVRAGWEGVGPRVAAPRQQWRDVWGWGPRAELLGASQATPSGSPWALVWPKPNTGDPWSPPHPSSVILGEPVQSQTGSLPCCRPVEN